MTSPHLPIKKKKIHHRWCITQPTLYGDALSKSHCSHGRPSEWCVLAVVLMLLSVVELMDNKCLVMWLEPESREQSQISKQGARSRGVRLKVRPTLPFSLRLHNVTFKFIERLEDINLHQQYHIAGQTSKLSHLLLWIILFKTPGRYATLILFISKGRQLKINCS